MAKGTRKRRKEKVDWKPGKEKLTTDYTDNHRFDEYP